MFSSEPSRKFDASSQARIDFVSKLKNSSHVHVLGACGTGTGAIVCLLKQLGFYVTGSDKAFYPPMGDFIKEYADKLFDKFSEENINPKPDLVVIGNALSRGNVELEAVLKQGLPFCSMPELLSALLILDRIENKNSVVVSGTHGKTTTTALISHALSVLEFAPGYFFGGVPTGDILKLPIKPIDKATSLERRVSVIEGDEYDSAFFAKYSKFNCYRPDIAVITNVEFDHGDIFEDLAAIENEFLNLLNLLPENGHVVVCRDAKGAKKVVEHFVETSKKKVNIHWYGTSDGCDVKIVKSQIEFGNGDVSSAMQRITLDVRGEEISIATALTGAHNVLNISAAAAVLDILQVDHSQIPGAFLEFSNVKRRQQIHVGNEKLILIEDFAHHPTEVFFTLSGIRAAYPNRRLTAVFEPRSNTSRKSFFKDEYVKALSIADNVFIKEVDGSKPIYSNLATSDEVLNVASIKAELEALNTKAASAEKVSDLFEQIKSGFKIGDVIVVMSNGDFGGLIKDLVSWGLLVK